MLFSIFTPKKEYVLWDRGNPHFFVILLFSLVPLEFFKSSRDEAEIWATVCEIQATQTGKEKEPCCICCWFPGGKQGSLRNLWVTCSTLQHPIWKVARAAKVENTPESRGILVDDQEQ